LGRRPAAPAGEPSPVDLVAPDAVVRGPVAWDAVACDAVACDAVLRDPELAVIAYSVELEVGRRPSRKARGQVRDLRVFWSTNLEGPRRRPRSGSAR
jgi:hypothetical protein